MIFRVLNTFGWIQLVGPNDPTRRHFGVPPRGAFDTLSHRSGNALLGNDCNAQSLELSSAACTLEILRRGVLAWTGAGAWQGSRFLTEGQTIKLAAPGMGVRSYLAGFGGIRPLGMNCYEAAIGEEEPRSLADPLRLSSELRVYRGSHAGLLNWHGFLDGAFTVSAHSNRMGVRLVCGNSSLKHEVELPSEPTDVGIVQLPPSGDPIVLGPDGPTIGGYPKLACVIEADLPLLAQVGSGQVIRFREIDREEGVMIRTLQRLEQNKLEAVLRAQATEAKRGHGTF